MFNFEQTNVPAVPDTNMRASPQVPVRTPNFPARSRKIYRIDPAMVSLPRRSENPERRNEACLLTKNPSDEHFTAVVMPHLDDAYALARWLSGNSTDAEDIVQEACLRALRGLDRYAGGNARAWLLAITR
ncbi:MAG: sigma factor, partial [Methylocella sp.]